MDGVSSRFKFDAIGTSWEIDTPHSLGIETKQRILNAVDAFDSVYSRFREDSIVTRIARTKGGGTFSFPSDAATMFDIYDQLHEATDGAVDPLIGRQLELMGYDRNYSLMPDHEAMSAAASQRPDWRQDVIRVGSSLTVRKPLVIDIGAVGKGILVDRVAKLLRENGIQNFVVDASGDMQHCGDVALDVGLEHPLDAGMVIGVANLTNSSICASASNRRRWGEGLHHIIDGRTGQTATDVIATWAIATDTAIADGLATALFFGSSSRLTSMFDFSFVRMFANGHIEVSDNFCGEIFI